MSTLPRHTIASAPPPRTNLDGMLRFSGLPGAGALKGEGGEKPGNSSIPFRFALGGGAPLSTLPRHTIASAPPPRANLNGMLRYSGLPGACALKGVQLELPKIGERSPSWSPFLTTKRPAATGDLQFCARSGCNARRLRNSAQLVHPKWLEEPILELIFDHKTSRCYW